MTMLSCVDPLNPRAVDRHFAREASAARDLGATVALMDHDALLQGDTDRAVERVRRGLGALWYRGWMIPSAQYAELASALEARGAELNVTPDAYRSAHELPGWYETFGELTPTSVWGEGATLSAGPGIVKDYVKSRKHEWAEACYIPDLADVEATARIVARFVELQGDYLAGGVVLREFESFVGEEARVWWIDGAARLVTPHPDSPSGGNVPMPDLTEVEAAVRRLGARFVTTDIVRREDGAWRVVEVGDGQVSDLHAQVDPAELLEPLLGA